MRRRLLVALGAATVMLAGSLPAYAAPNGFGHPQILSTGNPASTSQQVVTDGQGFAYTTWVEDAGTYQRVMAAIRTPSGDWLDPIALGGGPSASATAPAIATNAAGDVVVAWQQYFADPTDPHLQIACARRPAAFAGQPDQWRFSSSGKTVSLGVNHAFAPSVAVAPDGLATVGWADSDSSDFFRWHFTYARGRTLVPQDTDPGTATPQTPICEQEGGTRIGALPSHRADIVATAAASDAAGNVTLLWKEGLSDGGNTDDYLRTAHLAADGTLSTTSLVNGGTSAGWSSLAVAPDGGVAVGYSTASTKGVGHVAYRPGSEPDVTAYSSISLDPGGSTPTSNVSVAARPDGTFAAAYNQGTSNRSAWFTQYAAGTWSTPTQISPAPADDPRLAAGPDGSLTALWMAGVGFAARQLPSPGGAWSGPFAGQLGAGSPAVAVTSAGVPVVTYQEDSEVRGAALIEDTTPPTVALTKPAKDALATTSSVKVAWSGSDPELPVTAYTLLTRTATYRGDYGAATSVSMGTTSSATRTAAPGSVCYAVTATNAGGLVSAPTTERCVAIPVDDRTPARSSGWTQKTGSGYYAKTYLTSEVKGATLTLKGVKARKLGLLVEKGAGYGSVKVLFGGKTYGPLSLSASAKKKLQVIAVASLPAAATGTLKIVVSTSGKPVVIDGVHVLR